MAGTKTSVTAPSQPPSNASLRSKGPDFRGPSLRGYFQTFFTQRSYLGNSDITAGVLVNELQSYGVQKFPLQ